MATIQYVVNAVDAASATFARIAGSADEVLHKLDDIGRTTATARVALAGDKEATLTIDKLELKMANLAKKTAEGKIGVEGQARALLQIQALNLQLDKLNGKHATATVKVDVDRSALSRLRGLFPGGGGGAGGILSGLGGAAQAGSAGFSSAGGALGQYGQPALYGGLGALATLLGPAGIPALLGLGAGGLAVGGGAALGSAAEKQLQSLAKSMSSGTTAADKAKNRAIRQQMAQIQKQNAGPLGILGGIQDIGAVGKDVFSQALTGRPVIRTGGSGPGGHGQVLGQSFLTGLLPVFKQIQGFIKSIGPGLGDLFRASLPFLKAFVGVMEQFGKAILPVITQSLKQMQPYIPILVQGFTALIQGVADMIKAIGPRGMEASAKIFVGLMKVMGAALTVFGKVMNFLAVAVYHTAHAIHQQWDELRHRTADAFDQIRHDVARFAGWLVKSWIATGHMIESAWNTVWRNTVTRAQNGIADVVAWFKTLPGRAVKALFGLGHGLAAFASSAFSEMWNAIKNVAGSIWNWLTGWVQRLPGWLKHLLGIKSPSSVFYDIGKQMMMGLFHGIKDHVHHARNAAQSAAGGAPGFGVAPNGPVQQYARQLLNAYGWGSQWPQFNALVMAESGWRWNATNPSSGAYGIPQALPPGKMGSAGRDWLTNPYTQLRWMMGYIHDRWTNPAGAWANEVANHWYGAGLSGGIFSRPTLIGVGERGPERVDVTPVGSHRRSGGPLLVIENLYVREPADVDLLARRLAFLDA